MNKKRIRIPIYDILIISLLAGAVAATVFHISSHRLFVKSFFEFIDSCVYYGKSLFATKKIPNDNVSFLTFDETIAKSVIPADLDVFGYRFLSTFELLVNRDFFIDSWNGFVVFLNQLLHFGSQGTSSSKKFINALHVPSIQLTVGFIATRIPREWA